MRNRLALAIIITSLSISLTAQNDRAVDEVLDHMAAYLEAYQSKLIAITADELYEQQVTVIERGFAGSARPATRARRRLDSDVAFVRLPGSEDWAGFRDVQSVDGKVVKGTGIRLSELLSTNADVVTQAMAMTMASAKYNLGSARTINMPTVPLEVFHPRHRSQFSHRLNGNESIRGARTVQVIFEETGSPTVIKRSDTLGDVQSSGAAWVEPKSGKVWRVEVVFRDPGTVPKLADARLRVEFAMDRRLETMVPVEMRETFYVPGARGEGKATYKHFRRFETGARIVP